MKTKFLAGIAVVGAAVIVLGLIALFATPSPSTSVSNAEDTAVRAFVTAFGNTFKNVSLLADDASTQIATQYGAYIAPDLLQTWQNHHETAPGRQTSSPWPDRIEVVSVTEKGNGFFVVEGNVIEITSADAPNEPAAIYPVSMNVEKKGDSYVITTFTKGAYSELPKRITVEGYWECLPHKDTTGPQTDECALGIAVDKSDGHYAIDTRLMSTYPVDFSTGTKVRVSGVMTPVEQLSAVQKYDIDGVISATTIEKI